MAVSEKSISDKIAKTSILEELKNEIDSNEITLDENYAHKEDLERLLKLAEELKESCDRAKSRMTIQRTLTILVVITILSSMFYILRYHNTTEEFNYLAILIGLSLITLFIASDLLLFVKIHKQRYLADKSALSEVLQLLRETSNVIAEQEAWSVLSRAEFRIRLSRFNLEEKSKSAFNFFS